MQKIESACKPTDPNLIIETTNSGETHTVDGKQEKPPSHQLCEDVRKMSTEQLKAVEELLQGVDECAMSLVFSDHSTQLREGKVHSTIHCC